MKDIVSKVKSFVTFELPVQPAYVHAKFASLHERHQTEDPQWSTAATRQKLISLYWFRLVPVHFLLLLTISILLLSIISGFSVSPKMISVIFISAYGCYVTLAFFHYKPVFCHTYLPYLENAKAIFEGNQNEQLERCRQAQLSNFSLTLLFFVFCRMNSIDIRGTDERTSLSLMKVFGVDPGSIRKNLEFLRCPGRGGKCGVRKITEVRNRFNETYKFLEEIKSAEALDMLKKIETSLFSKIQ